MGFTTVILGNGFDLACGLRTKFIHMYLDYVEQPSANEIIKAFKQNIKEDKEMHFENWSDFEIGMAKYVKKLNNENELKECLKDFKSYMVNYLRNEVMSFIEAIKDEKYRNTCDKMIDECILDYRFQGLTDNEIERIKIDIDKSFNVRNALVFNYTPIIQLFSSKLRKIIQLHGSLGKEIIMGIDNEEQMKDVSFKLSKSAKRAFIKPEINSEINQNRINEAVKIINDSDIIIILGWAMGDSDLFWKLKVKDWLLSSNYKHLIYLKSKTAQIPLSEAGELLDEIDKERAFFMQLMGYTDEEKSKVENRIHIPINNKKFKLPTMPNNIAESNVKNIKSTYSVSQKA